jgi:hypothetical protein
MNPTEDQLRPLLSIDLGSSYTKVAWRPRWSFDPTRTAAGNRFVSSSVPIPIQGSFLSPTVAYNPGTGANWLFGSPAFRVKPGPDGVLFKNWKATLFDTNASTQEEAQVIEVARRYLEWLRLELEVSGPTREISAAKTRFCIPAFAAEKIGAERLRRAAEGAGWPDHAMLVTSEPKANAIGLGSIGRNHVNLWPDSTPLAYLQGIYDQAGPFVRAAHHAANGGRPVKLVMIDIGAFTTDFAICAISDEVLVDEQVSFQHGVAALDDVLSDKIREKGIEPSSLSLKDFETVKLDVYRGEAHHLIQSQQSVMFTEDCMAEDLHRFADRVLDLGDAHLRENGWFVITGGGADIETVCGRIREALVRRNLRDVQALFPEQDQRIATALGGASVIHDFYQPIETKTAPRQSVIQPERIGVECSCGGNPSCIRCWGSGWLNQAFVRNQQRSCPVRPTEADTAKSETDRSEAKTPVDASVHLGTVVDQPAKTLPVERKHRELIVRPLLRTTPNRPRLSPRTEPVSPGPIPIDDFRACWEGQQQQAMEIFCLEGWMGKLVFCKSNVSKVEQRTLLLDSSSAEGKAAWLRLLCLGTLLGVRAHLGIIQRFWETELASVWKVLIPETLLILGDPSYPNELDQVFLKAIHRQFTDDQASGEFAELWRRVFYDFRKLHHFVFHNDLPSTLLSLALQDDLRPDSLLNFLRSGRVPGPDRRWTGAIAQSMTSPLLFLHRELRRLEIIGPQFEPACFYMNSKARRVAYQLGWVTEKQSLLYDIESLSDLSLACYKQMQQVCPELLQFFDLPLQWYASQQR